MTGDLFEELVTWITKSLHSAEVTKNEKLIDIHTGRKRQVDVVIRIKNGPTEILGIVEARDRSRPVGVGYIEEVQSKKTSVGADFSIIVSNKGFYKSAIEKAKKLGIRLFSLKEALEFDWSLTTRNTLIIEELFRTENADIFILDSETEDIIVPHESVLSQFEFNRKALIFKSRAGEPLAHFPSLFRALQSFLQPRMKIGRENGHDFIVFFDVKTKPELFILSNDNLNKLVNYIKIKGFCWLEQKEMQRVVVSHYENETEGNLSAEILSMETSKSNERIDMIISNPNDLNSERQLTVRIIGEEEAVTEVQSKLQFWFTARKFYIKHDGKYYQIPLNDDNKKA